MMEKGQVHFSFKLNTEKRVLILKEFMAKICLLEGKVFFAKEVVPRTMSPADTIVADEVHKVCTYFNERQKDWLFTAGFARREHYTLIKVAYKTYTRDLSQPLAILKVVPIV